MTRFSRPAEFVDNAGTQMRTPRRPVDTLVRAAFAAVVALLVAYLAFLRPMHMRWGATGVEIARSMPGDLVVGNATFVATRAVTIDARPEQVWPWIVQMGTRNRRFVKGFEANRYMLWLARSSPRLTWFWGLYPVGSGQTRLVTRVRFRHPWLSPAIFRVLFADVSDIFTVRDAMLEVKARAESMAGNSRKPGYGSSIFGGSVAFTTTDRWTSIEQLVSSAASAPTAARMGAATVPTTPTVNGNSATERSPWRMTIRRTLPSRIRPLTFSSSSPPSTLIDSHQVRSSGMSPSSGRVTVRRGRYRAPV